MIVTPAYISHASYSQIRTFERLKPTPQVPAWEATATQFIKKGQLLEALILTDDIVARYGKEVGRNLSERIFGIPMSVRGRGLTKDCSLVDHPSKYALCQDCLPIQIGRFTCLRNGCNCLLVSEDNGETYALNALAEKPIAEPMINNGFQSEQIHWLALGPYLVFAHGTDTLTIVDLSRKISAGNGKCPLPFATLRFESTIKRLCGPIADGTFFVTLEPKMPVFSDICRLCQLNVPALPEAIAKQNGCDAREAGCVLKDILLPNVEQTLIDDCCTDGNGFITCGGGMQNREVRFIDTNGAWTTRFVHEAPVARILRTEVGIMSLDDTGTALLWRNQKPVADTRFDVQDLPKMFDLHDPNTKITVEWTRQRLYLTTTTPQPNLKAALTAAHSLCISPTGKNPDCFVKAMYHLPRHTLAMLADGSLHFWNISYDCVTPLWQLPFVSADSDDWHALLNIKCPGIDEDPRIRKIQLF